ncbi:MAG: LysR family transcriptional regulator [Aliiglaciecola sp.]|uniref:LysR family transcriptional regulator n=1 Tax=Aliiglaciecola sp. M165 TaxID=2593649 RepID=UPI00117CC5FC|nr:LysR family transcriptional regulator [Aliiglaciecola sp. M165]TRY31274.1 LysR family transcriptional regulator [Aliiglaciecola sp. M165]
MKHQREIQQLDLNLLKVFESLYQEQNMTRTAEQMHITPSAVSHAIKRLRECLQDPLFVRSKNQMLPTPACQRMAPLIIDNLSRLRQMLQQWGDFDPGTSQHHFRIGIHDALEPAILPKIIRKMSEIAPGTTLASIKVERNQLGRMLTAGQVDMVFDVAMPMKSPILHQRMLDDSFSILVDKSLLKEKALTQKEYFSKRHISVSHRPTGAAVEDLILQGQGLSRNVAIRCQNYYAARDMLTDVPMLLTLPTALAHRLCDEHLSVLALPFKMPNIETHLYWHQNTQHDHALLWFRDLIAKIMIKS